MTSFPAISGAVLANHFLPPIYGGRHRGSVYETILEVYFDEVNKILTSLREAEREHDFFSTLQQVRFKNFVASIALVPYDHISVQRSVDDILEINIIGVLEKEIPSLSQKIRNILPFLVTFKITY